MAITIDRVQRDAIYGQVINDLSGVDDISRLLDGGDIEAALRYRPSATRRRPIPSTVADDAYRQAVLRRAGRRRCYDESLAAILCGPISISVKQ